MCWVIFKCVDRLRSIDSYKANFFFTVFIFGPTGDALPLSSRTLASSSWAWICSWNLLSPLSTLLSNQVERNPISESVKASNCTCVKRIYCQAGRQNTPSPMCSLANSDREAGSFQSVSLASASQPAEEHQTSRLGTACRGWTGAGVSNQSGGRTHWAESRSHRYCATQTKNTEQQNYVRWVAKSIKKLPS